MPGKTSLRHRVFTSFALFMLPGLALAGQPTPSDYLDSQPLLLEIRYCECQATEPDGDPADVLPEFLDDSRVLRVGAVTTEHSNFVASRELSMGYEISPVEKPSGSFQLTYASEYTTRDGNLAGQGTLVLEAGQWVSLFESHHQTKAGAKHAGVAIRLVDQSSSQ
ncbi:MULTISPECIES: hypothetical protein [Marinobacter]|jgi:hypothetical protein|uniref:Lipoprotein n=1 Tax=Marinobacter salarius TaxID=1420917 RepID=W5YPK3_9GAMM|nr:hypothetical protein [Marinobacter salarius]AHI31046.1 hypothetical protein AU15_05965 [Marinobacter salarius]